MGTRSFTKSSVVTISVPAVQVAAFRNCCLRSGRFDGANRNHFFPRIIARARTVRVLTAGRRTWVITVNEHPTFTNLSAAPKRNPRRELATHMTKGGQHGYQLRKDFQPTRH